MNRLQAFTGLYGFALLMMGVFVGLLYVVEFAVGDGTAFAGVTTLFYWLQILLGTLSPLAIFLRRAHDLGLSARVILGWIAAFAALLSLRFIWPSLEASWVEVVMVAPLTLGVFWLLLAPGQPAANRFGEPPRPGWLP